MGFLSNVTDHGNLSGLSDDDHSIYLLASAATDRATFASNWTDLTDTGATTLHKHDHGGLDGLADDDHTGYALLTGRTGTNDFTGQISVDSLHVGGTSAPGDNNILVDGTAQITGTVYINDNANTGMTTGLTINQGSADNEVIAFKSSDVAHGITTVTETDTFGFITKISSNAGGMAFQGLSVGTSVGLAFLGYVDAENSTKGTDALACLGFYARKKDSTGFTSFSANSNIFAIKDGGNLTRFIVDTEGDVWASGGLLVNGLSGVGTSGAGVVGIANGTAPTTSVSNAVQLWSGDIGGGEGKASLLMMSESGTGVQTVVGVITKTDTGDSAQVHEGLMQINTFDNTVKIYADGAWRTIASGW